MKYTLVGAGAIGGTMAAWVSKAGGEILYVDAVKEHVDAMNSRGLTILNPGGEDFCVPVKACMIDQLEEPLEVVFLAVKSQHTRNAMEKIAPLLKPDGYVVSLQNGINEPVIAEYVGEERVVGAFVNWAADYIEPGVIRFGGQSNFSIGELNGNITERLYSLREFLAPFTAVELSRNIMGHLWSKQVNISAMFATGVTDLGISKGFDFPETQETIAGLALEAMAVPEKIGVELTEFEDFSPSLYKKGCYGEALKQTADHYRVMAKDYTGLYRDLAVRKRKSEIDGTVGFTVELGEKMGLKLPLNRRLLEIVKEIEAGKRRIGLENLLDLKARYETVYGEIDVIKSERKSTIQTEPAVRSRNIVETQGFCYNGGEHLTIEKEAGAYVHQLSAAMGHSKGARHEERGLAACRRSDYKYDCQHGKGRAYQHENAAAYLRDAEL